MRIDATLVCKLCLTGRFGLQVLRKTRTWSMAMRKTMRTRRASRRSLPARGSPGIEVIAARENRTGAPTGIPGSTAVRICHAPLWLRGLGLLFLSLCLKTWCRGLVSLLGCSGRCNLARHGSFVESPDVCTVSYRGDMWLSHGVHQLWIPWRTFHPLWNRSDWNLDVQQSTEQFAPKPT